MSYAIKEIYFTIQGEGFHTGKDAVFCRFSGCNLWSGLEKDRSKAVCNFCDTDFFGTDGENGGKYSSHHDLINQIEMCWPKKKKNKYILPPNNIDWICVSPKKNADLVLKNGDELKLVYPQKNFNPKQFELLDFTYFSIQPMDGKQLQNNILKCVSYCMENPLWRLSLQTHKIIGVK